MLWPIPPAASVNSSAADSSLSVLLSNFSVLLLSFALSTGDAGVGPGPLLPVAGILVPVLNFNA